MTACFLHYTGKERLGRAILGKGMEDGELHLSGFPPPPKKGNTEDFLLSLRKFCVILGNVYDMKVWIPYNAVICILNVAASCHYM